MRQPSCAAPDRSAWRENTSEKAEGVSHCLGMARSSLIVAAWSFSASYPREALSSVLMRGKIKSSTSIVNLCVLICRKYADCELLRLPEVQPCACSVSAASAHNEAFVSAAFVIAAIRFLSLTIDHQHLSLTSSHWLHKHNQ